MIVESVKDRYNEPVWNLDEFTKPNGIFVSNQKNQITFLPTKLPPTIDYDGELIMLLAKAERKIGELKGKGNELANPNILIRAYLKREAVLSSKIEGTLASLEDLNRQEAIGNIGKNEMDHLGLKEVRNYVDALENSLDKIKGGKQVDLDLLRDAHKKLLKGVRGEDKHPGRFRDGQNWIVKRQGTISEIIYTPPPPEKILELLNNLQTFFQADHDAISPLVQCAIIHYQFEAIHPFLDGNGRIGRLLLPLILYEKGLLPQPLLYLSAFFDKHREEYYNGLLEVSQKSRWSEWIKFFLQAFSSQADETIKNIQKLSDLRKKYVVTLKDRNASSNAIFLMEYLFNNPYITIPNAGKFLRITYPAAKNTVMALVNAGILKQTDIKFTSKVFLAEEIEENLTVD